MTRYAATNPFEDIAESFTDFILLKKPADASRVESQKILFFYDYPELVELRDRIRTEIKDHIVS